MLAEHTNESFVARIWFESGKYGDPILRGHIRHVQSEEELYFQGLWEMQEFLSRVSGISGQFLMTQPEQHESGTKGGTVVTLKTKPEK